MKYKIVNVRRYHGRENIFYADLRDENDELIISAELDYVLKSILGRNYKLILDSTRIK